MSKNFVVEVLVNPDISTGSLIQLKSKIVASLPRFRKQVIDINIIDEDKYIKAKVAEIKE